LCPYQLSLQAALLIFDVLFLEVDVPATVSHLVRITIACDIL
jgi:predicted RNA-binding protein